MSVDAITAVFRYSAATQTTRSVLTAAADRADEHGICWPSLRDLAARANCSERTVRYAMRRLEDLGEIEVIAGDQGGAHQPRLYRITLEGLDGVVSPDCPYLDRYNLTVDQIAGGQDLPPCKKDSGGQVATVRGAKSAGQGGKLRPSGGQPVAPEPSVTTKEPKENRHVGDGAAITDATLSNLLADLIEANTGRRPTVIRDWLDAERLLLNRDKRDPDQAARLLRWAQNNEFWRSNVLSMPKFREKYDQLLLQARRGQQQRKQGRAATPVIGDRNRGQHEKDLAWATENIPDLPAALVASAIGILRLAKADITIENVRGRLAATGRIPTTESKVAA